MPIDHIDSKKHRFCRYIGRQWGYIGSSTIGIGYRHFFAISSSLLRGRLDLSSRSASCKQGLKAFLNVFVCLSQAIAIAKGLCKLDCKLAQVPCDYNYPLRTAAVEQSTVANYILPSPSSFLQRTKEDHKNFSYSLKSLVQYKKDV